MLRISRLTDYAIVLMSYFGHAEAGRYFSALQLSEASRLPRPTVSKLLKTLSIGALLESRRGARGGYSLTRRPQEIAITDIIQAIEGPIALTDCTRPDAHGCEIESGCPVRSNWMRINARVVDALRGLTLDQMAKPLPLMEGEDGESMSAFAASNLVELSSLRKR